jgi:hypothetical protein
MLFLLGGWGPWATKLIRRILASNDEVVNFGEDLDVSAIVHDDNVIIICAILVNRGLIRGARGNTLFLG